MLPLQIKLIQEELQKEKPAKIIEEVKNLVLEVSSFRSRLEQLLNEMRTEHHHGKSGQTAITLIPEISPDGTVLVIFLSLIQTMSFDFWPGQVKVGP